MRPFIGNAAIILGHATIIEEEELQLSLFVPRATYLLPPVLREPSRPQRSNLSERSALEDETLIAAAQQGDAAAFEELVLRYQEAAFRAAFLVLRDADEAQDAAQEGFVKAYKAVRTFRRGHQFRPWLLRIVINQSLTTLRSRRRGSAAAERLALREQPLPNTLDETVIDRERARLVWAALQSLREQERVVVYLRFFVNLPERELAAYLGCAQGTVKSRLHRALAKLRDVVASGYPELLGEMS